LLLLVRLPTHLCSLIIVFAPACSTTENASKKTVINAVDECGVDIREENCGVEEHNLEGLDDSVEEDGTRTQVPLFDLG